jgi:hypothetical protein
LVPNPPNVLGTKMAVVTQNKENLKCFGRRRNDYGSNVKICRGYGVVKHYQCIMFWVGKKN